MTNRITQSYNNNNLLAVLSQRDETINAAQVALQDGFIYSDDDLQRFAKYQQLTQFEKDLLYLYANHSVIKVAELYGVTKQYIYKLIKKIYLKLK